MDGEFDSLRSSLINGKYGLRKSDLGPGLVSQYRTNEGKSK